MSIYSDKKCFLCKGSGKLRVDYPVSQKPWTMKGPMSWGKVEIRYKNFSFRDCPRCKGKGEK